MIRVAARAKVNLRLAVVGRRPDGYHDLETVMQSVALADELTIERSEGSEVVIRWAHGLTGPVPQEPDIVQRTMAALRLPPHDRFRIHVEKRIPIGSGLGGASADAAAALVGLERLQTLDPLVRLQTAEVAAGLGADVPFCLRGGLALATGIGVDLAPIRASTPLWWVIGISEETLPTVQVYRRFDELVAIGGRPEATGSTASLVAELEDGDLEGVAANLANDLELAAFDLIPQLAGLKRAVSDAGALGSVMTGSGSAIVGLCRDQGHAHEVANNLTGAFARVEVTPGTSVGAEVIAG